MNPLLRCGDRPAFDEIRPEHIAPAMTELLEGARLALDQVTQASFPAQWTEISKVLDTATELLSKSWGAVAHLMSVADNTELRAAHNAMLPAISEFWASLGANELLYAKYKAIDVETLDHEQRQAHKNAMRNFVLGGAELQGAERIRFAHIQELQADLAQRFSEHALDATDAFSYFAAESELAGVPADVCQAARHIAEAEGKAGFKLTLKMPCYLPVMQFAHSSPLRQMMYRAYVTRASDQAHVSARQFDNTAIIRELLSLRQEEAALLGYRDFASLSLATKMAPSAQAVIEFLRDLGSKAKPFAMKDVADLRAFAAKHLEMPDPQPWDWAYIGEKLKEARYAFSDNEVKQYFQLPRVLDGLFGLIERLFDVKLAPDTAETWHPDVRFYRIERAGHLIGQFYLDMYARPSKRPGAWMNDARGRKRLQGGAQTPVAYLVCNVQSPVGDKPALLTHDDVITLFHEFGHGLHHMLTRVDELGVSGISGVEWDAVELPSQFMENFCWEWDIVSTMSAHVDAGAPLPRALFDRMLAAKNFQSGMQTLRQVEFSLFDMRLHSEFADGDGTDGRTVQQLLDEVRSEVAVLVPPDFNRFQNSFSHIFAGGYAAGYYSYKWAEVLSADCYAAFEEEGVFNPDTGRRFLDEILSVGGSRPAIDSFRAFRGRAPSIDALLRHNGMVQETSHAAA